MESGYLCYYCNEKFDLFKDIFNHLIEKHNAETFKIKKSKFCEKEGVLGYTTVNYKFKPLDDILTGKNVVMAEPDRILILGFFPYHILYQADNAQMSTSIRDFRPTGSYPVNNLSCSLCNILFFLMIYM